MEAFVSGAGTHLEGAFDADWPSGWVRGLKDESAHLAAGSPASAGFQQAGADPDGDGVFTAEDQAWRPSSRRPTIAEAQRRPRAGRRPSRCASRSSPPGSTPTTSSAEALWNLSQQNPQYRPLFDQLVGVGAQMWDEDFAAGFYDSLGPEGTHVLLGVVDTYAARYEGRGLIDGGMDWSSNITDDLLLPLVGGFAGPPATPTCSTTGRPPSTPRTRSSSGTSRCS